MFDKIFEMVLQKLFFYFVTNHMLTEQQYIFLTLNLKKTLHSRCL